MMSLYVAVLLMVRRHPDLWWLHAQRDARVAAAQSALEDIEYEDEDDDWDDEEYDDELGYNYHEGY
jgi:hypothetical protein